MNKKQILILSIAILLVFPFGIFAQDQKVKLIGSSISLKVAFDQIEKQTGLSVDYDSKVIDVKKIISTPTQSIALNDLMLLLLKDTKCNYVIKESHIIINSSPEELKGNNSYNKNVLNKITGLITDENGGPIIGATIKVLGSNTGTVSDIDGKFAIEARKNSVLNISYVGYTNYEVTINSQKHLKIILKENTKQLDEVVVMGYSNQKKSELSSSAVTLSADKLTDVTSSDIGNLIQGKISGVVVSNASGQPGSNAEIRIRGTGSITADAAPLYVVDGIPGGSFNPNDILSLTVLKDAGATALYGSAAAGGVIVVTTKTGNKNQRSKIDLKTSTGIKEPLFGNFVMMNSQELYYTQKELFSATLFPIMRPSNLLHQNFDWQKAFFKTGIEQNYFLSASGGTNKLDYYSSLDYYDEKGTLINTGFKKISGRLNLNAQLNDKLNMNIRLSYTDSHTQGTSSWTTLNDAYTKMPWDSPYDANGNIEKITSSTRVDGSTWYSQDKWNSLHNELYNYNKTNSHDFISDFQLNWNILDWLVFTTTNRFNQNAYKNVLFVDPRTYSPEYSKGFLSNVIGLSKSIGTTNLLKITNKFGKHSLNALLGQEWGQSNIDYTLSSGIGMPNGLDALNATQIYRVGGYTIPIRSFSGFAQVQYSNADKYFAVASIRADASSIFAQNTRIGTFPSGAASWLISKEDFLKNNSVITFLKLRASYGLTGNSNIGMYKYLSSYALSSSYQGIVAAIPTRLANPNLGWEKAYMGSLGLDLNLWKSIELNIDLYNTDNKDLLLAVPVSPSTGFFEITANSGSVRNQGIEFQLNTTNIKNSKFEWSTSFNVGFNKNTVTETPKDSPFLQTRSSVNQQVKRGQDIYSWFMPKWLGVDPETGDPLWEKIEYDANENIISKSQTNNYNEATFQIVGKATPIFSGGFINNFKYKSFFLSINTNFVYGNKIFNYNRMALDADGAYLGYNQISIERSNLGWTRWKKQGDIATHPKLVINGNKSSNSISSRYLEDGSFFRVKNIKFGYELPKNLINPVGLTKCKIYFTGDNLFTFTKFSGMDPEVSLKTSEYILAGLYSDNYPISKQLIVGLEIGF